MESPPLPTYIPQKSKKRVFPGGSSSYMESEIIEISSPIPRSSKSKSVKLKEVVCHEIIDVDMDEDCGDVMLIDGKVDTNNKGKEALANFSFGPTSATDHGSVDGVQSSKKSCAPGSHNLINLDGFSSELSYGDDEYIMDMYCDDLTCDDEYSILQSHFDNIDIPPGVEAPIPWLSGPAQNKKKPATASSSTHSNLRIQLDATGFPPGTDKSHSPWLPAPAQIRKRSTSKGSTSLRTQVDAVSHPHKVELTSSWSFAEPVQSKMKLAASTSSTYSSLQTQRGAVNLPSGVEPFKSWGLSESSYGKRKPVVSDSITYYSSHNQLGSMNLSPGIEPFIGGSHFPNSTTKQFVDGNLTYASFHTPMDAINLPPGVDASMSMWQDPPLFMKKQSYVSAPVYSKFVDLSDSVNIFTEEESYIPGVQDPTQNRESENAAGSSTVPSGSSSGREKYGNQDDILKKFNLFKKFDTVQDHSDHHYSHGGSSVKQPSKNWAKKIQEEWRILEKDLPDTIFVRVYETRMDLLRAVIVGAEGTPYHDGLFFFDVFFPCSYPNVPPHVYYHSGGLRINPNLYNCGKVCLSLLNTWSGDRKEKWIPGVSTMLQVLVSIQGLILNAKPFFNEPGFASMNGSASGEKSSLQYNENTFILSLKTMMYTMRRPPKYFEDFVVGHFCKHAHDILVACKAYMDGAQVGCLVKGGVQDVDEGDKSCSQSFKETLAGNINTLVKAFTQFGATNCEKFLSPAQKGNMPVSAARLVSAAPKTTNVYFS